MKRLAILGGGQLALMLAEAAARLHVPVRLLAASGKDPAARGPGELHFGRLEDEGALREILAESDVVTLENEFVDVSLLERVLAEFPLVSFEPPLATIWEAQDKLRQKRVFVNLGIDTAPFEAFAPATAEAGASESAQPGDAEIAAWLDGVSKRFGTGSMLKWSRWGYDGKGNCPFRRPEERETALAFCREGLSRGAEIYAEEWIAWERELAMVATRGRDGQYVFYPLVASYQENSVCREVRGPAAAIGAFEGAEKRAIETVRKLGDRLGATGTFAVEFFWTADGRMLANEMAPRVHNTGHYSRHTGIVSQFENHVRAVVGLPLRDPAADHVGGRLFGMRNLLGPEGVAPFEVVPRWADEFFAGHAPQAGVEATWYGKRDAGAWRKMGHLTVTASSAAELESGMKIMASLEERFWKEALARKGSRQ